MNIRFLKFIVIFMGVLIAVGIITLGFSIYYKINNLSNYNEKRLIISPSKNSFYKESKILEDRIVVYFEKENKFIIKIYNFKSGKKIKEIEILK